MNTRAIKQWIARTLLLFAIGVGRTDVEDIEKSWRNINELKGNRLWTFPDGLEQNAVR